MIIKFFWWKEGPTHGILIIWSPDVADHSANELLSGAEDAGGKSKRKESKSEDGREDGSWIRELIALSIVRQQTTTST